MKRILIIEDDAYVRRMLSQTLERAGYTVATANDGADGLDKFRQAKADLVITDIVMPEKEGLETIMSLHQEFPDLPIIAISGGGHNRPDPYLDLAERLGAECSFKKPVDRQTLLAAVERLLQKSA